MTSTWLRTVVDANQSLALDSAEDRETLVTAIIAALPGTELAGAILGAIEAALKARGIPDGGRDVAYLISENIDLAIRKKLGVSGERARGRR
jgi:hypothetical protein